MLYVPSSGAAFGASQDSDTDRPGRDSYGLLHSLGNVSSGGKSAWQAIVGPTADPSYGIAININAGFVSSASINSVLDFGFDETGSGTLYEVRIPDLICGNAATPHAGGFWYFFPIFIPSGTIVAIRGISSRVNASLRVACSLFQQPLNPSQYTGASFVRALGINGVSGVSISPGTTTDGLWTLVGTTEERVWWWQFGAQVISTDVSHLFATYHIDVAVGNSSVKNIVINNATFSTNTNESAAKPLWAIGSDFPVPAGVNVYVRAHCSTTLPDTLSLAVYAAGG